jgi:hypothetical protein
VIRQIVCQIKYALVSMVNVECELLMYFDGEVLEYIGAIRMMKRVIV